MKIELIILIIIQFLFSYDVQGQTTTEIDSIRHRVEKNYEEISKFKTKASRKDIESLLIGTWKFINIQTIEGKIIDTLKIEYYDNTGVRHTNQPEIVKKPDMTFAKNHEYSIADNIPTNKSSGTWSYIDTVQALTLYYKKPYFPDPIMETVLKMPGLKSEDIWIYKITNDELYIMDRYPINEYENWVNLLYFRKNSR